MKLEDTFNEQKTFTSSVEIYQLQQRDGPELLGYLVLNLQESTTMYHYSGDCIIAKLKIVVTFIDVDSPHHTHSSIFYAGYIQEHSLGRWMASISTTSAYSKGAIQLNPSKIRGNRGGTMIMSKVIAWLKQYPEDTPVNSIDYAPYDNHIHAFNLYKHINMPIDGSPLFIKNLAIRSTWERNILPVSLVGFRDELEHLHQKKHFLIKQKGLLNEQQEELVQGYYHQRNPFKAYFDVKPIQMCLLDEHYAVEPLQFQQAGLTDEKYAIEIGGRSVRLLKEIQMLESDIEFMKQRIERYIYEKNPDHRWQSVGRALVANYWRYRDQAILMMVVIAIAFGCFHPEFKRYYVDGLILMTIASAIYLANKIFNPKLY